MKNEGTLLLLCGCFAWSAAAADAPPQKTNDVHQRALEVLRQLEGFDKKQIPMPAPPAPAPKRQPTAADVEQFYLQGKITAKEYQKYLEDHRLDPARVPNRDSQAKAIDLLRNETNKPGDVQSKSAAGAVKPTVPPAGRNAITSKESDAKNEVASTPEQSNLSDLEKKMDELLRLKAAREAAATNNTASNTATNAAGPVVPKNKRDRLNDLLKLYIDGKIQDAGYKEQRAKIVAEPD
jgi:hypothetical protein